MSGDPNKETPEQELRAKVSAKLAQLDQGQYLGKGGYDQCTEEVMRLFVTHYKAREAEIEDRLKRKLQTQIKVTKSYCGCPMCEHHTEAYALSKKRAAQ